HKLPFVGFNSFPATAYLVWDLNDLQTAVWRIFSRASSAYRTLLLQRGVPVQHNRHWRNLIDIHCVTDQKTLTVRANGIVIRESMMANSGTKEFAWKTGLDLAAEFDLY